MSAPEPRLGRVRIARIAKHEAWFVARYLHAREEALAAGLPVTKRRVELVAGRVAARRVLGPIGCVLPATDEREGAPEVCDHDGRRQDGAPAVSITHGAGWAIAATVPTGAVGVDLERVEPRHASFVREVFSGGELERFAAALSMRVDDPRLVTAAWCTKEALLKVAGTGLRAAFPCMVPTRLALPGLSRAGSPPRYGVVETAELGEVALALELSPTVESAERVLAIAWKR